MLMPDSPIAATLFSATVHVDYDGQPIYRLHIDPRCLTIGAERGRGPKLHLTHQDDCRCGDLSMRLVEPPRVSPAPETEEA